VIPFAPPNSSSFSKQDETHEKEEEEQIDKEEQTREKEVAHQEDSGSSN